MNLREQVRIGVCEESRLEQSYFDGISEVDIVSAVLGRDDSLSRVARAAFRSCHQSWAAALLSMAGAEASITELWSSFGSFHQPLGCCYQCEDR